METSSIIADVDSFGEDVLNQFFYDSEEYEIEVSFTHYDGEIFSINLGGVWIEGGDYECWNDVVDRVNEMWQEQAQEAFDDVMIAQQYNGSQYGYL